VIERTSDINQAWTIVSNMQSLTDTVVARINGDQLTLGEFMRCLKLNLDQSVHDMVLKWSIAERAFVERNLVVTDEEIDQHVESYRAERDLFTQKELQQWLDQRELSEADFLILLTHELKLKKLMDSLCEDKLEKRYALHKAKLDRVELYTIEVEEESVAVELRTQLDEGADFFGLAKKYSEDESTRSQCGYMGVVNLSRLAPEVEGPVVCCPPGGIVGPIKSIGSYHLYRVEQFYPACLDEETSQMLKDQIFEEWLDLELKSSKVEWLT